MNRSHQTDCSPRQESQRSLLFVNRSYWPDAEATGQLLTELCEGLASHCNVAVLCGQPNQNPSGATYLRSGTETRHAVAIHRVGHTRFGKRRLLGRAVNMISFLCAACFRAMRVPRPDVVIVETDPPLLCFLGFLMQKVRRTELIVYLQDIYPDVAVALGKIPGGMVASLLRRLFFAIYRRADLVIVLSQDMRDLLIEGNVSPERIRVIPNWIDTQHVTPIKQRNPFRKEYGLEQKFVVMYSGNLGLSQRLDHVLDAWQRLPASDERMLVFVGDGAARLDLEAEVKRRAVPNVRFLDYQPKSQLAASLSAADLHLVLLDPRITQFLMPSKLYGVLASGTASLVIADPDSELARTVCEAGAGVVVPPGDIDGLAAAIDRLVGDRESLRQMADRARETAVRRFDRSLAIQRFVEVLVPQQATTTERSGPAATAVTYSVTSRD